MSQKFNLQNDVLDYSLLLKKLDFNLEENDFSPEINVGLTLSASNIIKDEDSLSTMILVKVSSYKKNSPDSLLFSVEVGYVVTLEVSKNLELDLENKETIESVIRSAITLVHPVMRDTINDLINKVGFPSLDITFEVARKYECKN